MRVTKSLCTISYKKKLIKIFYLKQIRFSMHIFPFSVQFHFKMIVFVKNYQLCFHILQQCSMN